MKALLMIGALVPNLVMAMPSKCEVKAHAQFQKQAVEIEMASIVGNVSSIELVSRREGLQKRLEREQAHCIHFISSKRQSRTYASAESHSL
jgi:hypothetical protein